MKRIIFDWKTWMLAIRPRTLPAAAAGVLMGAAMAWHDRHLRLDATLVCLFTALLLQIGSNLANDVFDFERGTDTVERLGPMRVTQAELLSPRQVKIGMAVVFSLAALLGLYLAWLGGWVIIILGIAAIISAIAYTGGPFPLGYYGLGDIFVFIFFGLASVAGTYYIQAGSVSPAVWWMTIPPGLIITAILVVNNLRDIENPAARSLAPSRGGLELHLSPLVRAGADTPAGHADAPGLSESLNRPQRSARRAADARIGQLETRHDDGSRLAASGGHK